VLEIFIKQLAALQPLSEEQAGQAVEQLIEQSVAASVKADFLTALAAKGESPDEMAAFARALRMKSVEPPIEASWRSGREILDVCGTGGDRANTFNISTTVALVCAAAGVPVAKHGNRAITSQAGSADVLEALGVKIDLGPKDAADSLRERNFAFFFAPKYHPAFAHIAAARKLCAERRQRTIFNYLGPLLNPARPSAQLVGVPRPELCEPLAQVLQSLGVRRGMVVSGSLGANSGAGPNTSGGPAYLDELSTLGENRIAEFYHERGFISSIMPLDHLPFQPAQLIDLAGGDSQANAQIVRELLSGKERGPKRDAILFNSAAALFVAGRARTLAAGYELAGEVIDSGESARKLAELSGS
jgi:anthranilate phosphoribosyltransferase